MTAGGILKKTLILANKYSQIPLKALTKMPFCDILIPLWKQSFFLGTYLYCPTRLL